MKKKISYNNTGELTDILNDAMTNLKNAIDINTVVGSPIQAQDGSTIIPVSKVYCGIIAGGGEVSKRENIQRFDYPFAGGTGAGFTINPIGFLISKNNETTFVNTELDKTSEKVVELLNRSLKIIVSNLKDK